MFVCHFLTNVRNDMLFPLSFWVHFTVSYLSSSFLYFHFSQNYIKNNEILMETSAKEFSSFSLTHNKNVCFRNTHIAGKHIFIYMYMFLCKLIYYFLCKFQVKFHTWINRVERLKLATISLVHFWNVSECPFDSLYY